MQATDAGLGGVIASALSAVGVTMQAVGQEMRVRHHTARHAHCMCHF